MLAMEQTLVLFVTEKDVKWRALRAEKEDRSEEGMRVPVSVLNGYRESFISADEKREKAIFHAYGHQWPYQIIYHLRKCKGFGLSDDTKSIQGYGHWLHRQWLHCQIKKNMALDPLLDLDVNGDILHAECTNYSPDTTHPMAIEEQGSEVITTILALEKTLDAHKTSVHELEMQLYVGTVANVVEFNLQLAKARS
ncbi:hypothetical protein BDR04DRAFT_1115590 [Suillus decipiens]|nr:hypothetical protein BDR04DRAFT_1115590 [Suillus decipiens]